MPDTFLGMDAPHHTEIYRSKTRNTSKLWASLFLLSLVLTANAHWNQLPLVGQTVFYHPEQSTRILAEAKPGAVVKPVAAVVAPTKCSAYSSPVSDTFNVNSLFPILPSVILNSDSCSPPYWNLDIIKIFIYKVMALLNYSILVAAIVLTIYAGILYLTGFQNEGNIKQSKTILTTTYVGLIISLSATLILRTTISIAADCNAQNAIQDNNSTIFNGTDSKSTAECPKPGDAK